MKKIYKAFLALGAILASGISAMSQEVPYYINSQYGIGYNKTIQTDPATGNRFIRLETFATGGGEPRAIPSDIVLVLDNSGSMLYSYLLDKSLYKQTLTEEEVVAPYSQGKDSLLIEETQFYLRSYTYRYASNQSAVGNTNSLTWPTAFTSEANSGDGTYTSVNCGRYAKYDIDGPAGPAPAKYYRVFQRSEVHNGTTYYYLCFKTENGYMYLSGDEFVSTPPLDAVFTNDATANKVIFKGNKTKGTLLYRSKTRMEKLLESVKTFVNEIYLNNQSIAGDLEPGQVGNQIAIVCFGNSTVNSSSNTSATGNTQVIKGFTPVTASNLNSITSSLKIMNFTGNTCIGIGMQQAYNLLNNLQNSDDAMNYYKKVGGQYVTPLTVNRSKTVVVFTDGTPTSESAYTPYTASGANSARARAIGESNKIKTLGQGNINGKIFSVALNPTANDQIFMEHVSSNYRSSTISGASGGSGTPSFGGAQTSEQFYFDAGTKDLKEVFEVIASAAGGSSTVSSTSLINIDIVSKSFRIDDQGGSVLADNIKVYTAQCLGLDPDNTYVDGSTTKHYLAFAEPVAVGDRPDVPVLWTSEVEGEGESQTTTWTRETDLDIDGGISVTVASDPNGQNDVIKVTGFDYGKLWCGFDGVAEHDNSEQYDPADYGDYILGTGSYIKGYRGFKLIIDIPIALQDNAVGGPKVETNEPGSGLADASGTLLVPYPVPTITVPVNLWIQKEGLKKGESASFTILRRRASDESSTYEPFTDVLVTGQSNADGSSKPVMVKLLNLDASYYYKILEDGWTWSYSNPAQEADSAPTTETVLENPIKIVNTAKPNMPKHAESVANNRMGTSSGGGSTTTVSTREHTNVAP